MTTTKRKGAPKKGRVVKYTLRMTQETSRHVYAEARKREITACDWINERITPKRVGKN